MNQLEREVGHDVQGLLLEELNGTSVEAKNYLAIDLVDEVEESDDVPFSGMKSRAQSLTEDWEPNNLNEACHEKVRSLGVERCELEAETLHAPQEVGGFRSSVALGRVMLSNTPESLLF